MPELMPAGESEGAGLREPSATADETPADAIRSLKDHVGLRDSSFTYSEDSPSFRPRFGQATSGV